VFDDLIRFMREPSWISLALAIPLGWSVFQLAHGVAAFVDALFFHLPPRQAGLGGIYAYPIAYASGGGALTWGVHQHVVTLDGILIGAIEVTLVVLVATFVARRRASASS
jgi:hypothetical protein